MARRIRAFDWSTTQLGPLDAWPHSLRTAVQTMLASPVPIVMLWGTQGHMVYNDAYAVVAGGRHPVLLGQPVELGWPEVAEFNRNVVDTCLGGGTLSYRDKALVLFRTGQAENVWMDLYYSPLPDDEGRPSGVTCTVVETTQKVLSDLRREEAEAAYRATNERLQLALNTGAVLGLYVWDVKNNLVSGDERFARTFSYPVDQSASGLPIEVAIEVIHPDDVGRIMDRIQVAMTTGEYYSAEYRIRRPDGGYRWVMASGACEFDETGKPRRFPGVLIDIHERKIAEESLLQLTRSLEARVKEAVAARSVIEEKLRQSQKLEAIGAMTGGVAHDFNNLLQVISGNLQLLALQQRDNPQVHKRVAAASEAVRRGAKLSAQLLAFARRQPLSPTVVTPDFLLERLDDLLLRAIGETVALKTSVPGHAWPIEVDRSQLETAVLNLAINARDAMHGEGVIELAAQNVTLDAAFCAGLDVEPGDYLCLEMSDTGSGMSEEVMSHALEPFFTTKPEGHGTGLGLSMVFGFVKQSGGHLSLSSDVGKGTTVRLYFPRASRALDTAPPPLPSPAFLGGTETVLVVEDDAAVRATVVELLRQFGYTVHEAADGDAAMNTLESGVAVDLIFTDVVMPGRVKSADLARWAKAQTPPIPVLFTSGHIRDVISKNGVLTPDVHLLTKPYEPDTLAKMIRLALVRQREKVQL